MNPDRGDPKLTFKGEVIELPENPGTCLSEIFKANWVLSLKTQHLFHYKIEAI